MFGYIESYSLSRAYIYFRYRTRVPTGNKQIRTVNNFFLKVKPHIPTYTSLARTRCIFQDVIAQTSPPDSPAVDDERSASLRVEAAHLAMEGQERVGELRSSQVRPTGEMKLAHTSHLFQRLFHNVKAAQNRANESNITYIYNICYVTSTHGLFICLLTGIFN